MNHPIPSDLRLPLDSAARLNRSAVSRGDLEQALRDERRDHKITRALAAQALHYERVRGACAYVVGLALFLVATFQPLPEWLIVAGGLGTLAAGIGLYGTLFCDLLKGDS